MQENIDVFIEQCDRYNWQNMDGPTIQRILTDKQTRAKSLILLSKQGMPVSLEIQELTPEGKLQITRYQVTAKSKNNENSSQLIGSQQVQKYIQELRTELQQQNYTISIIPLEASQ